jgi:hypothetical protein
VEHLQPVSDLCLSAAAHRSAVTFAIGPVAKGNRAGIELVGFIPGDTVVAAVATTFLGSSGFWDFVIGFHLL